MAYRLEPDELIAVGLRRAMAERLLEAIDDLTNPSKERDKGIHDARKNLKRLRASLRLIRGEIGKACYRRENARFRDAARHLASSRDAWVMVETLDRLRAAAPAALRTRTFQHLRRQLVNRYRRHRRTKEKDQAGITEVLASLRAADVAALPGQSQDFSTFSQGLRRSFRLGRRAMGLAYAQPTSEAFHEWRKQVKYLWYQMEFLSTLWPTVLENLAEQLHRLSELLGDEHDLAVLRRTLLENAGSFASEGELLKLVQLIDAQRLKLQAGAQPLGERIYSDSPRTFTRRFKRFWQAWHAEDQRRQTELVHQLGQASPNTLYAISGRLTTAEMAVRLDLPVRRVRALIRARQLPAVKLGSIWIIQLGEGPRQRVEPPGLLGTREAAAQLGVAPAQIRRWIVQGRLPAIKLGPSWLIAPSELMKCGAEIGADLPSVARSGN